MKLIITDTSGVVVGNADINTAKGSRGATVSVTATAGTYKFVVSSSQPVTNTQQFTLDISYPSNDIVKPTAVITSPSGGATVAGSVAFTASATDDTAVTKVEFYSGSTLIATDTTSPYTSSWDTTKVTDGQIAISVKSFDAAGNIGTAAETVTVMNTTVVPGPTPPPTPTSYFNTQAVGAALPSDATCASLVRPAAEVRTANAVFNATKGTTANTTYPRVTGNYAGTTDQILQWVSCKWGIDENMVRAQAAKESWWFNRSAGDFGSDPAACLPGHTIGSDGQAGLCPQSIGILQVRYPYHQSAFVDNNAIKSTAYNADYAYAVWRDCYEGKTTWLNTVDRGATYVAGDAWGCIGVWYSGRWYTQPAVGYINAVKDYLNQNIWTTPNFISAQ